MANRPTEEQALTLAARRAALKRNLALLNSDFERVLVLLVLIGFKHREIARFEVGISPQRIGQIIKRGVKRFGEEAW
jgi:DNA-directed RNA polymerase specialized sigma24 family protein